MTALSPMAKKFKPLLEALSHCSTRGVVVQVGPRCPYPEANGAGRVWLPACLFEGNGLELLGDSWRHELQHARDALDGRLFEMGEDEAERRARQAAVDAGPVEYITFTDAGIRQI